MVALKVTLKITGYFEGYQNNLAQYFQLLWGFIRLVIQNFTLTFTLCESIRTNTSLSIFKWVKHSWAICSKLFEHN